ncbi:GTP-binding elongation factor family protein [Buchnera aphidicola (Cinara tujafilina)]|uniref:50S ribosomal subunit assembly factor BipA n=1 Tax=Buchnera aphidicola (Cinara tujafilina) TaxID=261317 RepID=F7WZI9_9GAMM|nr:translational GTPase TypA [Buchnera aphidicola]AEH39856.1 GTP-binding elongation factor family protein [Buchnera aphidicola (Cinara tujafilina)]
MKKMLRNIAIIAHVDHGKTTLLDQLLQKSGTFKKHEEKIDRIMDSHELEKERGITISAKNTSIEWNSYHINIIDTPGHADFGGEVERILSMVDSVLLVVDAFEGPMPQTRYVTKKAFSYNIKPIVIINKMDRPNIRPDWVINQTFDLFVNLNANNEQLDFPIIYTSALLGTSGYYPDKMEENMDSLFKTIVEFTPKPKKYNSKYLQMQISQLDWNNYFGTIGIGKITKGILKVNQTVSILRKEKKIYTGKINKILKFYGLKKIEINKAAAGDIIAITGLNDIKISDTICDPLHLSPLPSLKIDLPTVKMFFCVNKSPFCGQEGKYVTSRQILQRLKKEQIHNVSLKVKETKDSNVFSVSGRGELHLSILLEQLRRENFELEVSRPKVILKYENNQKKEPFELVYLDIINKHQGSIMKKNRGITRYYKNITSNEQDRVQIECILSSRSLIGFRTDFMNLTSGSGTFFSSVDHYGPMQNHIIGQRKNGVLISNGTGVAVAFALYNLQNRGKFFLKHAEKVYEGQIIGIHNRSNDLTVNCLTGKKLTNMRASGTDEAINLTPPINITLEYALNFVNDDELIEITPKSIRFRKIYLTESERKKHIRNNK